VRCEAAYADAVLRPLLGGEYLLPQRVVALPPALAAALLAALRAAAGPRAGARADALHPLGALMPDHTRFAAPALAPKRRAGDGGAGAGPGASVPAHQGGSGAAPRAAERLAALHQPARQCGGGSPAQPSCAVRGEGGASPEPAGGGAAAALPYLTLPAGALCVELKPKCGCLPESAAIAPAHAVKRAVPRYVLHQRLKLAQARACVRLTLP
jgi:hypothetical protein